MAREPKSEWKEFRDRVRRHRAERGLSQAELARRVPVYDTYLSDVENGRRNIALTNIVLLAKALDMDAGTCWRESVPPMGDASRGVQRLADADR
jgi:transcriptional regulator with XRE-family HTH domain